MFKLLTWLKYLVQSQNSLKKFKKRIMRCLLLISKEGYAHVCEILFSTIYNLRLFLSYPELYTLITCKIDIPVKLLLSQDFIGSVVHRKIRKFQNCYFSLLGLKRMLPFPQWGKKKKSNIFKNVYLIVLSGKYFFTWSFSTVLREEWRNYFQAKV